VFKASTHPKFKGKTAEQREKMARMAQYKAVQNKKTLSESKKRKAKTLIDGMIKSLIKQGRTHDEAVADLKRQVDSRFYEHIDAVAAIINETFDKPYKSKWGNSDYDDIDVLAKLPDGTPLSIMFNREGDDEWQVEFHRDHSTGVTGQGDAQRIFATVITAIQKFIKKRKPQVLRFSATREVEPGQSSQSRAKLYDRIVQRYAHAWGYDMYQEDHGDQVTYELTRLNADVTENFADGKGPGRPGDSKRHGIPKHATLAQLDKIAHQGGRKGQLAHWQANMRRGRAKTNEASHQYKKIHPTVVANIIAAVPDAHEIWFHGSRAIGTHKSKSDWDFLVIVPKYNNPSEYIDVIDRLHKIASKYKNYDIQPSYANNIIARIAKEEGRLLWSADTAITEAIAPHGDSWNELNLMKIGEKPAALVGPQEFEKLYKPVMRKYNWIWTHVTVPNPDSGPLVVGFERYIIGQPGEQARIARMQHLILQMNSNLKNGIKPDANYHIEMGRLLGYSDTDIAEFLKKINM
jgi:predicted nucleotidyltransferase